MNTQYKESITNMTPIKIKTCLILTLIMLPVYSYALNGTITSSAGVQSVYTDNLYLTDQETKTYDLITYLQPGLSSRFETPGTQTSLSYGGNYSFYKKHDDNNTLGHTGSFSHVNRFTKFSTLTLSDTYTITESLQSEQLQQTDIRSSRQKYATNSAAMGYAYQFGVSNTFNSSLSYNTLENDDKSLNDNQSFSGSMGIDYQLFSHLHSSASVSSNHTEYSTVPGTIKTDDSNNFTFSGKLDKQISKVTSIFFSYNHIYMRYLEGDLSDYHVFDPSAGLSYTISEDSHLSLGLGWRYEKTENDSDDDNFYASINLNKAWAFKKSQYQLSASNGYDQTFLNSENNGINYYYQTNGSATYQLTRTLNYSAGAGYRYNIFETPGVDSQDSKDHSLNVSTALKWQYKDFMTVSAGYEFNLRNSDDNTNDYKENRAQITINLIYWNQRL